MDPTRSPRPGMAIGPGGAAAPTTTQVCMLCRKNHAIIAPLHSSNNNNNNTTIKQSSSSPLTLDVEPSNTPTVRTPHGTVHPTADFGEPSRKVLRAAVVDPKFALEAQARQTLPAAVAVAAAAANRANDEEDDSKPPMTVVKPTSKESLQTLDQCLSLQFDIARMTHTNYPLCAGCWIEVIHRERKDLDTLKSEVENTLMTKNQLDYERFLPPPPQEQGETEEEREAARASFAERESRALGIVADQETTGDSAEDLVDPDLFVEKQVLEEEFASLEAELLALEEEEQALDEEEQELEAAEECLGDLLNDYLVQSALEKDAAQRTQLRLETVYRQLEPYISPDVTRAEGQPVYSSDLSPASSFGSRRHCADFADNPYSSFDTSMTSEHGGTAIAAAAHNNTSNKSKQQIQKLKERRTLLHCAFETTNHLPMATVNGLRVGTLANNAVPYPEINTGCFYLALLLDYLVKAHNVKPNCVIRPNGVTSTIDVTRPKKATHDFHLSKKFFGLFNSFGPAWAAYAACLDVTMSTLRSKLNAKKATLVAEDNADKRTSSQAHSDRRKRRTQLQEVNAVLSPSSAQQVYPLEANDKLGSFSIKYGDASEASWTNAVKCAISNIRWCIEADRALQEPPEVPVLDLDSTETATASSLPSTPAATASASSPPSKMQSMMLSAAEKTPAKATAATPARKDSSGETKSATTTLVMDDSPPPPAPPPVVVEDAEGTRHARPEEDVQDHHQKEEEEEEEHNHHHHHQQHPTPNAVPILCDE